MLSTETIVVLFRIVNFILVILLFVYLFSKYFYSSLKQSIEKFKNYFFNLKHEANVLSDRSNKLDVELLDQQNLSNALLKKILIWKKAIESDNELNLKEKTNINEQIYKKLKFQENLLTINEAYHKILPKIILNTEQKIKKEFETEQNVSQFQNELINFLKKN